jgi:hypothetical protein
VGGSLRTCTLHRLRADNASGALNEQTTLPAAERTEGSVVLGRWS